MSTAAVSPTTPTSAARRIVNVMRLNLSNPWTSITLPLIILAIVFGANIAIWWLVLTATQNGSVIPGGTNYSSGVYWIFIYMGVVASQTIAATFPFAQGYGVTRRDFWLGSGLTFLVLSLGYSALLSTLASIEELTGGWGFGAALISLSPELNWAQRFFIFVTALLFFFFLGATIATIWVRWKATGVTVFFVTLGLIVLVAVAALTLSRNWAIVGDFFAGAGLIGSFAWSLVLTAIAAVTGYLILRRATPRAA